MQRISRTSAVHSAVAKLVRFGGRESWRVAQRRSLVMQLGWCGTNDDLPSASDLAMPSQVNIGLSG